MEVWGSHPDEDNDDCQTADDFDDKASATAVFLDPSKATTYLGRCVNERSSVWIMLNRWNDDGTWTHVDSRRLRADHTPESSGVWNSERAHQAGMMGGIDAYNDAIGSS